MNETEYILSIPELKESLLKSMNAPLSEFVEYIEGESDIFDTKKTKKTKKIIKIKNINNSIK